MDKIAVSYSPRLSTRIVEMVGRRGQTQPREWRVVAYDERAKYLLRTIDVSAERRIDDEGDNDDLYPQELPIGFASVRKLRIDSPAAFKVLEREALKARVGFDSVDYKLRSFEFSDEPLWSLTARDERGRVVGRVIFSGYDGRMMRTVWFYKQPSGYPRIVDSALTGRPLSGSTASTAPGQLPPLLPPTPGTAPGPAASTVPDPGTPTPDPDPDPATITPPSVIPPVPTPTPQPPLARPPVDAGDPGTEQADITEITEPQPR